MITSDTTDKEAYVWIWLPEVAEPVVAEKFELNDQGSEQFNYGKSYLECLNSNLPTISIYESGLRVPKLLSKFRSQNKLLGERQFLNPFAFEN